MRNPKMSEVLEEMKKSGEESLDIFLTQYNKGVGHPVPVPELTQWFSGYATGVARFYLMVNGLLCDTEEEKLTEAEVEEDLSNLTTALVASKTALKFGLKPEEFKSPQVVEVNRFRKEK